MASSSNLALSQSERENDLRARLAIGSLIRNSRRINNNNNNSNNSNSNMDDAAARIAGAISRLEARERGEIPDTSRSARDDFLAVRKKGKKSRKGCIGAPWCTNAACNHPVPYTPTLAEPKTVEQEKNIIKTLLAACEKRKYPVSEVFAKQSLYAREWKIKDAWEAIKKNIDDREEKYRLTGRTSWVRVNVHADRRPNNPLGAKEPRNERIKWLEDDDATLHDILTNNWTSQLGKDIKVQYVGDKNGQQRQYKMYRREAYYRSERAKYQANIPDTKNEEECDEMMDVFDEEYEPRYEPEMFPEDEAFIKAEAVKAAEEALAAAYERRRLVEEELEQLGSEKPYGPYTKQYNALRAKMVREGHPPTSGWLPSHGDIKSSDENIRETTSSLSANPLDTIAESIHEDDGNWGEASTASCKTNLPRKRRSPFTPLTIEDLEAMSYHEEVLEFLLLPNGRDIMYEKLITTPFDEKIERVQYWLRVYDTELDSVSKEAVQLELLKYQSHKERIEAKDYKTIEKLPNGNYMVRFDNHGDEAAETEELRAADYESLMRPRKYLVPKVDESQDEQEQPKGFMGMGFEREQLESILEGVKTSGEMTSKERGRQLCGLTESKTPALLHTKLSEEEDKDYYERVMAIRNQPGGTDLNFQIPSLPKPKIEDAKEAEETKEQDPEPGLSEKAKGKRPIRPWEQNIEHNTTPVDLPDRPTIMKPKLSKSVKQCQKLFKQISKSAIKSKISDLGLDDETVAELVRRFSDLEGARTSAFTEHFDTSLENGVSVEEAFNTTPDPDDEEINLDDYFADDASAMDDLQEPFPDLDDQSITSDKPESTVPNLPVTEPPKYSGAMIPPRLPSPEPRNDTERALREIRNRNKAMSKKLPTAENNLFKKIVDIHVLMGKRLSTGPWRSEDIVTFLSLIEDTKAQDISIELICKLLGLCDNNPIRAHSFFKAVITEASEHFTAIGMGDAEWAQYETIIVKWEAYYWTQMFMMKEVMQKWKVEWILA